MGFLVPLSSQQVPPFQARNDLSHTSNASQGPRFLADLDTTNPHPGRALRNVEHVGMIRHAVEVAPTLIL